MAASAHTTRRALFAGALVVAASGFVAAQTAAAPEPDGILTMRNRDALGPWIIPPGESQGASAKWRALIERAADCHPRGREVAERAHAKGLDVETYSGMLLYSDEHPEMMPILYFGDVPQGDYVAVSATSCVKHISFV